MYNTAIRRTAPQLFTRNQLRILLLAFFALCFAFESGTSAAEHLRVVSEVELPVFTSNGAGRDEIVASLASIKGGVVLAGQQGRTRAWATWIANDLGRPWDFQHEQGWPEHTARAVADASDGGYWIVGAARSRDTNLEVRPGMDWAQKQAIYDSAEIDFLAKLDPDGSLAWIRSLDKTRTGARCLIETASGIVVLGYRDVKFPLDGGGSASQAMPWLRKFDRNGNLLWDIAPLNGSKRLLLSRENTVNPHCDALIASVHGGVVLALTVAEATAAKRVNGSVTLPRDYVGHERRSTSLPQTLVLELDASGATLRSVTVEKMDDVFIFRHPKGYLLVQNTARPLEGRGAIDLLSLAYAPFLVRNKVSVSQLDDNLHVQHEDSSQFTNSVFPFTSALPDPKGGLWLTVFEGRENVLIHLDASLAVTGRTVLKPLFGLEKAYMSLGLGDSDDSVIVFMSSHSRGNVVVKVSGD